MTKEEKQLLLIDLCARLPYNPFIKIGNDPNLFKLSTRLNWIAHYGVDGTIEEAITDNKPYLRPMSSMTEEEDKEWQLYKSRIVESCDELLEERVAELHDWFNRHHFDYRNLIERGLALEAPEDMYKTE